MPLATEERKKLSVGCKQKQKYNERICGVKAKAYSYLTDDNSKCKKQKAQKMCNKIKYKFEDYQTCLQASQRENRIIHSNKADAKSPIENQKSFQQ